MLQNIVKVDVLTELLGSPDEAVNILHSLKSTVIEMDMKHLNDTAILHPSAKHVAGKDWNNLWDKALDHGPKGTKQLQRAIRLMCQPIFKDFTCPMCRHSVDSWTDHTCISEHPHPPLLNSNGIQLDSIFNLDYIFKLKLP